MMDKQSITKLNVNLLVLSKYNDYQRLYVRDNSLYSDRVNIYTSFKRFMLNDSRETIIDPIRDLFKRSSEFLEKELSVSERRSLVKNIKSAYEGIKRLNKTYANDVRITSEIDEISQFVVALLHNHEIQEIEDSFEREDLEGKTCHITI